MYFMLGRYRALSVVLTGNRAIVNVIMSISVFPAITSENVYCEKQLKGNCI